MKKELCVNVNDVARLLERKHRKRVMIDSVEVADLSTQHKPKKLKVGVGGVLNVGYHFYGDDDE